MDQTCQCVDAYMPLKGMLTQITYFTLCDKVWYAHGGATFSPQSSSQLE